MRERLRRVAVAATILATLLMPAVTSVADPEEEDLQEIERELEDVREDIEAHEAEAGALEDNIDALNDEIIGLRDEVTKLDGQIADIESEVRSVQARIDGIQKKIDAVEADATRQAIDLYKSGGAGPVEALLDSQSLSDLNARLEFYGTLAEQNTGALIEMARLQEEIRMAERELFERKDALTTALGAREDTLAQLDVRYDELSKDLAALEDQLGEEHAHEGHLEAEAAELKEIIIEEQAQGSVEVLGVSASGYIWPVNGAVTSPFGPRWGRLHAGIDIDGSPGQPIVASNSGRVILAGGNGGYGNCVVIDHGGGVSTLYAHMTSINVSNGQNVAQGTILGTVGCTGSCTGPHLHFEVRVNGAPVNPLGYLP